MPYAGLAAGSHDAAAWHCRGIAVALPLTCGRAFCPPQLAAGNNHREVVDVLFPVSAIEGESVESLLTRHIELRRQENEA